MKKRILLVFITIVIVIGMSASLQAVAASKPTVTETKIYYIDENKTDGFKWTLYSDGNLVIEPASTALGAKCVFTDSSWVSHALDIKKITFSKETYLLKNSYGLFKGLANLTELSGAKNINFTGVKDTSYFFSGCSSLSNVDVSEWNLSSVEDMSFMFWKCEKLEALALSDWDISSATDTQAMFADCSILNNIDVSRWDTSLVTDMLHMFSNCVSLTNIDVSDWDTSSVTRMYGIFSGCSNLSFVDVSDWDMTSVKNMGYMFRECKKLKSIDVSKWDTSSAEDMQGAFYDCESLESLDVSKWDVSAAQHLGMLFQGCSKLENIDVSKWDTSSATNLYQIFYSCTNLTYLDVSNWDVSSVTDLANAFSYCPNITNLDVSGWDVSNVKTLYCMFYSDSGITSLDVSNWDVSNVTNMDGTFEGMKALETLDVSGWDTSSVTNMNYLFRNCRELETVDVSNWDVSSVTNMRYMFNSCGAYKLDFSKWDTSLVTDMKEFLDEYTKIHEIRAGKKFVFCSNYTGIAGASNNNTSWTLVSENYSILKKFSQGYYKSGEEIVAYQNLEENRNGVNIYRLFAPVEYNLDSSCLNLPCDAASLLISGCPDSVPVGMTSVISPLKCQDEEYSFSRWTSDENKSLIESLTNEGDISYLAVSPDAIYVSDATIKLTPVLYYTHKYALEKYKYARSSDALLIIYADKSLGTYYYDGQKMFYTEDMNYRDSIDGIPLYVFVTIIPDGSYDQEKLARIDGENNNESIERNGDVNDDIKVTITDVTDINNMVKLCGDAYSDMSIQDRLEADINTSREGAQNRGSILDVTSSISLVNE